MAGAGINGSRTCRVWDRVVSLSVIIFCFRGSRASLLAILVFRGVFHFRIRSRVSKKFMMAIVGMFIKICPCFSNLRTFRKGFPFLRPKATITFVEFYLGRLMVTRYPFALRRAHEYLQKVMRV